jgi:hypothetical protein
MEPDANLYNSTRSELVAWIAVEYALIGLTAASIAAPLGFFKQDTGSYWIFFSTALLLILSCLGSLTAFARAKIMVASAYIIIFHPKFADFERRLKEAELENNPAFRRKFLFTRLHKVSLIAMYFVLGIASVFYPYSLQKEFHPSSNYVPLALLVGSGIAFGFMIYYTILSYDRLIFEKV